MGFASNPCTASNGQAEAMPTIIRKLTQDEFSRLYRHGFEVADYTLHAYNDDRFGYVGYGKARSSKV